MLPIERVRVQNFFIRVRVHTIKRSLNGSISSRLIIWAQPKLLVRPNPVYRPRNRPMGNPDYIIPNIATMEASASAPGEGRKGNTDKGCHNINASDPVLDRSSSSQSESLRRYIATRKEIATKHIATLKIFHSKYAN